jgi:Nucleoporin autopeptidase
MQPVDVRGLDLDAIVDIEKGKIVLYPDAASLPASTPQKAAAAGKAPGRRRSIVRGVAAAAQPSVAAGGRARGRRSRSGAGGDTPSGKAKDAAPRPAVPKPPRGGGLNVPALLTFRRMVVKSRGDAGAVAAFRGKLEAHAAKIGAVFVHYETDSGTWVMKVDGF